MRFLHRSLALVTLVALAGCDAAQFNKVNESFSQVKTTSKTVQNVALPAAAAATGVVMVEFMSAMAQDTQKKAGVIAVGGMNYGVAHADGPTYTLDEAAGKGTLHKTDAKGNHLVDATFEFTRAQTAGGGYDLTLKNLKGTASGYTLDLKGLFAYTPSASMPYVCKLDGTIKSGLSTFNFSRGEFSAPNPLPTSGEHTLGALEMKDEAQNSMGCEVKLVAGKFQASGAIKDAKGNVLQSITLDENGLKAN